MRNIRTVAVAVIAMSLMLSQWAAAQALNLVPADALFVIKINNAKQVSQKFADYTTELGIAQFQPALQDPLGSFKQEMGVQQGLREDGDIIFAFINPQASGVDSDNSMIVLLPITDFDAFIGNFEDTQTENGVTQFRSPNHGQPAFAANWGEYAAISPARELVAQKPESGITTEGLAARMLDDQDAVVYANIEKIATVALPALRENRERITAEMQEQMADNAQQARYAPVMTAIAERGMDIAEAFLQDARSATWSLNLGDKGLNSTLTAEFKPDTYGARTVNQLKGTDDSLISGLPEGRYLMYGGSAVDPQLSSQLMDDLLSPIIQALGEVEGSDAETAGRFIEASKAFYGSSSSQSWGMLAPTGALGAESLVQTVLVARGDGEKMLAAQKDIVHLQNDLMQAFAGDTGQEVTISYSEDGATAGGVQFDRFTTDIQLDPNSPEAAQAQQALQMLYGPGGLGGFSGVVDGKLVTATGLPEARLEEIVQAARAEKSLVAGQANVQAVSAELPEERVLVLYVPLDQWVTTAAGYAAQFGMPVQVQLPPDLPPIGMTYSADGEAVRYDLHLPTDLVQSLVAAGMQAVLGQMGPGGGGL